MLFVERINLLQMSLGTVQLSTLKTSCSRELGNIVFKLTGVNHKGISINITDMAFSGVKHKYNSSSFPT